MSSETEISISLKTLHPAQRQILAEKKRFNVLKCGRRFGKTELAYDLVIQPALDSGFVAYYAPTYKDLNEFWINLKSILWDCIESKDETVKQLRLITGGVIDMWSLEDANGGRGRKYHRVVVDECEKAGKFKEAWEQAIRATLTDYKGDAWFLSTPKFGKTFFKQIFNYKDKFENWNSWKFTTYDNPNIDPKEVDEAGQQLEDVVFQCEYLAEDVDLVLSRFATKFDKAKHVVPSIPYDSDHELYISFDFNVEPCTALLSQYINEEIRFIDEIRIMNSDSTEVCDEIVTRYPSALTLVTLDASGQARTAIQKNVNHLIIIKRILRLMDTQIKVSGANPSIRLTRILCNSLLQNFKVLISKEKCPFLIEDLTFVEVKDGDTIDKSTDKHRGHLLDNFRYTMHAFHRHLIKYLNVREPEEQPAND